MSQDLTGWRCHLLPLLSSHPRGRRCGKGKLTLKSTQRSFDLASLIISPEQLAPRTDGIHVSQIVRKLSMAMGKRDGDFTEEQLTRFAVVGRLWERVLGDIIFRGPRYSRPGDIDVDDIHGNPDSIDGEEWAIAEFKVCFKSYKDFEGSQKWHEYIWQIKSYCYQWSMCRARLIVLFPCGNWRDDPVPTAFEWDLLFTPQELAEHWAVMRANA